MAAEQMYFTPEKQTKQHIVNAKLAAMAYAKLHECDESWDTEAIEWLRDRTTVIEFDRKNKAAVIVQAF